jgi:signal transduction histidine kinase
VIRSRFIEKDQIVRLDYHDNAGGIQPDVLSHIFEPFFTTKGGDGTGLGLAISKQIIAEHGGSIDCESQDGLTRFTLLLPATLVPKA